MHTRIYLKTGLLMALSTLLFGAQVQAATFVYVSNSEDGDIGMYTMQSDGSLRPGPRFKAEKIVMPMTVSPDKRVLVAAVRSKPFSAYTYSIDRASGQLTLVGTGPLAESFPYISSDRSGRFLFGASYGGHLVSVNPVGADGRVGAPANAKGLGEDIPRRKRGDLLLALFGWAVIVKDHGAEEGGSVLFGAALEDFIEERKGPRGIVFLREDPR